MRMDEDEIAAFVASAVKLAQLARQETLREQVGEPENKDEGGAFDPVTAADRGAERVMRAWIGDAWPEHGISGEEYGETVGAGPWSWSLDPIDGTRAYVCGLPSWTTLIALLHEGRPVVGIIDAPRLDELCLGEPSGSALRGAGASAQLRTSGCRTLTQARFSTTDPYLFSGAQVEAVERVRRAARLTRYGLDAYGYARLAAGTLDVGGRRVDLSQITAPFLHLAAQHDHIVPAAASAPLIGMIGSTDKEEVVLKGGHVSLVAGGNAIRRLWPRLVQWLATRST